MASHFNKYVTSLCALEFGLFGRRLLALEGGDDE